MSLLNYTTKVPVTRTVSQVQTMLADAGAHAILTNYNDGHAVGLSFSVDTIHGARQFSLPVDAKRVEAVLQRQKVDPRFRSPEHAERVAWRIIKDWLEAQLAIIRTEMVTLDQVMLSYMHGEDGRTVYDLYRDRQLALPLGDNV